jgi:excisionase family DNA binding protein
MPVEIAGIKMYSAKEVSEILGVHIVTARRYMAEGRIKAKKIGGNRYFVSEAHLREFLETPDNIPKEGE